MIPMFKEGPIRRLLKGQVSDEQEFLWETLEKQTADALPAETDAKFLYMRLSTLARDLGLPDVTNKFDEIAKDEEDHYRIIKEELLPVIHSRRQ